MMAAKEIDQERLREELIGVFSAYVKDPTDALMKKRARKLHTAYGNVGRSVDSLLRHCVSLLVNIGWDLPEPPKPGREEVEKLLFALASGKV